MQIRPVRTAVELPNVGNLAACVAETHAEAPQSVLKPSSALHACLYGYQRTAATFLADRAFAYLADEPGTGKSASSIGACDLLGLTKIIVFAPPAVIPHWVREFNTKSLFKRRVLGVYSGKQLGQINDFDVIVISYDLAARNPEILTRLWDVAILDEAQAVKNPEAKRTKALLGRNCNNDGLLIFAERVWALTASPAPNHPGEMWALIHAFVADKIPFGELPYYEFCEQYSYLIQLPRGGIKISGGRNLDTLRAALAPYLLRRLKVDVLSDLPGLRISMIPLNISLTAEIRSLEGQEEFKHVRKMLRDMASSTNGNLVISGELATYLRYVEYLKTGTVAGLLIEELRSSEHKVVVFVTHHAAGDQMMELLSEFVPVRIVGGQSAKAREDAITRFQNDPAVRVCVAAIGAASVGITLTAASEAVFLSSHWTPEINMQAVQRLHRIGQANNVSARFFTLANSADQLVMETLVRKTEVIAELFDSSNYGNSACN
jgi:SWI/SNF-related matrix-associated actin-dependent regulator 1 of chromatin subfamily A